MITRRGILGSLLGLLFSPKNDEPDTLPVVFDAVLKPTDFKWPEPQKHADGSAPLYSTIHRSYMLHMQDGPWRFGLIDSRFTGGALVLEIEKTGTPTTYYEMNGAALMHLLTTPQVIDPAIISHGRQLIRERSREDGEQWQRMNTLEETGP